MNKQIMISIEGIMNSVNPPAHRLELVEISDIIAREYKFGNLCESDYCHLMVMWIDALIAIDEMEKFLKEVL